MRILSLDVGSKSIGFAISDEMKIIAQPLENFWFPEEDWEVARNRVLYWIAKYSIELIIIGLPTLPSGDDSKTTIMIRKFKEFLKEKIDVEMKFVDENHSTKKAHSIMIESGLTRKKRKEHKDKISAVIILQDYLKYV